MTRIEHSDDVKHRQWLRDTLTGTRELRGWGQPALAARLNRTTNAVAQLESSIGWRVPVVQRWARGLDRRVVFHTLHLPDVAPYPLRRDDTDAWVVAELAHRLTEARRVLGVTQAELAGSLGISRSVAAMWELRAGQGTYLWAVQARTRALGGVLRVGLAPMTTRAVVSA